MWVYSQSTGKLSKDGVFMTIGYSGHAEGKNNPNMQSVPNVGPIPVGLYYIEAPIDTDTHGPFVLRLTPDPKNEMFDRSGFLVHGDSIKDPGSASHGCIIMPRYARERMWDLNDHVLRVVSGNV